MPSGSKGKRERERMRELKMQQHYRMEGSTVCIDIKIDFYREVFNSWDFSPMINRDLDDDLFEYMEACCREIPKRYKISIVLHIPQKVMIPEKEELNTGSFRNFFKYKIRKLKIAKRSLFMAAIQYFFFGIFFITLSFLTERLVPISELFSVLREGFNIGGWVLFWELFHTLFFRKSKIEESMIVLERLHDAKISYRYS
jgi:hypothetical protein